MWCILSLGKPLVPRTRECETKSVMCTQFQTMRMSLVYLSFVVSQKVISVISHPDWCFAAPQCYTLVVIITSLTVLQLKVCCCCCCCCYHHGMLYVISVRMVTPVHAGFHGLKGTSTALWWGVCWKAPLSCTALLQTCCWLYSGPLWYDQLALVSFDGASYLASNAQPYDSGQ